MASREVEPGSFEKVFGRLLSEYQDLRLGRVNLSKFHREHIKGYEFSVFRRQVDGKITLQPKLMEEVAAVLDISPEMFLEYRVYRLTEALKRHPALVDVAYRPILDKAAALDDLDAEHVPDG